MLLDCMWQLIDNIFCLIDHVLIYQNTVCWGWNWLWLKLQQHWHLYYFNFSLNYIYMTCWQFNNLNVHLAGVYPGFLMGIMWEDSTFSWYGHQLNTRLPLPPSHYICKYPFIWQLDGLNWNYFPWTYHGPSCNLSHQPLPTTITSLFCDSTTF